MNDEPNPGTEPEETPEVEVADESAPIEDGPVGNIGAPGTPGPTGEPVSAADNLGPHLLGRVPSPPDARDYKLETFLSTDPVDAAVAAILADPQPARATKTFAQFCAPYLKAVGGKPVPTPPTPPAPAGGIVWANAEPTLDQGSTGHCVGFGSAQWGNTDPVDDHYTNADGDAIYYECKVIDGEPNAEDGSTVRSGVTALKNRGRLAAYAFTSSVETIKKFILANGPIIVGTDWYQSMFTPDANGYVSPSGVVAGGHCYIIDGFLPASPSPQGPNGIVVKEDTFVLRNSWGSSWAIDGQFYMTVADFATLLAGNGEAVAAVELP
jgi:hypothetical protein